LLLSILLYPLVLHVGLFSGSVTPGILVLSLLLLLSGAGLLLKRAYLGWGLVFLGIGMLICQTYYQAAAQMMLFLPPVLINLLLCFLFVIYLSGVRVSPAGTFCSSVYLVPIH